MFFNDSAVVYINFHKIHLTKSGFISCIILCACFISLTPHIMILPVEKTFTDMGLYFFKSTAGKSSGSYCNGKDVHSLEYFMRLIPVILLKATLTVMDCALTGGKLQVSSSVIR